MKSGVTYHPKPYETIPFGKVEITNFLMCNVNTLELTQRLLVRLGDADGYDTLNWVDLLARVLAFPDDEVVKALREIGFDIVYDAEAREQWLRR